MKVVILGAGISGLAAGYYLKKAGVDYTIYEKEGRPGGLCRTENFQGIPFDYGVHMVWGGVQWWKEFIENELGVKLNWYDRNAIVQYGDSRVRYPFQYNLRDLPEKEMYECLIDFIQRSKKEWCGDSFLGWAMSNFGESLAKKFFEPFNEKLLCTSLTDLSPNAATNVFVPTKEQLLERVIFPDRKGILYGGNAKIGYPAGGGIESIIKALSKDLNIECNKEVVSADNRNKTVTFKDGEVVQYDKLISSIPLNDSAYSKMFDNIRFKSVMTYCTMVVLKDTINREFSSWIYYPESKYSFYRITVLGNLGEDRRALLVETSSSKDLNNENIFDLESDVLWGLKELGADITEAKCSTIVADPSYTLYTHDRDEMLEKVNAFDIKFIGRYGTWNYMSMHQAFKSGKKAAEEIVGGLR